jgi:hypothetical protein
MTDTIPVLPRIGGSFKKSSLPQAQQQPANEKLSDVFDDLESHEKTSEETVKKPIFWSKDRIMMAAIGFVLVLIVIVIILSMYQSYNKKQVPTNIKQPLPPQSSCLASKIPSKDELLSTLSKIKDNTKKFINPSSKKNTNKTTNNTAPKNTNNTDPKTNNNYKNKPLKKQLKKAEPKLQTVEEEEPSKTFITEDNEEDEEVKNDEEDPDEADNELSNKFVNELSKDDNDEVYDEADAND